MEKQEAVDLINSISYRPGVKIEASVHPRLFSAPETITVTLQWATKDTGRDPVTARNVRQEDGDLKYIPAKTYAELGYTRDFTMLVTFAVPVRDSSPEEVLAYVLRSIIALEVHEAREFFRVGAQDYRAPFHPHRPDGTRAWAKATESNTNYQPWADQDSESYPYRYAPVFTKSVQSKFNVAGDIASAA